MIYLYYFLRSVVLRGLLNTIRLLKAEVDYEKKFGIHTSAIKKSESKEFFHYQGASYKVLLRVFEDIRMETTGFDFVDIGCGKGRAVYVAEYCGFNNLTGIELDGQLVQNAIENNEFYRFKRKQSTIEFIHANALDYVYKNRPTVYFLFNPFNEDILKKVLNRIKSSTTSETWFIYMNPQFLGPFKAPEIKEIRKFKTRFYTEALVFSMINKLH